MKMLQAQGATISEENWETLEEASEEDDDAPGDSESEQDVDPSEQDVQDPEPSTTPAVAE